MHIQPSRRSSLFLLELIIAILFFSLAATVCVRFFVESHTLERQSVDLGRSVSVAASVAEILRSTDDFYPYLQDQFPQGEAGENSFVIGFDTEWNPCLARDCVYRVLLQTETQNAFLQGQILVTKGDISLYTLTVEKYLLKEDIL